MPWKFPSSSGSQRRASGTSVLRIVTAPHHFPSAASRRGEQRFRIRTQGQGPSEIDQDQAITIVSAQEPERKRFGAKNGSMDPVGTLCAEHGIVVAEREQVAKQSDEMRFQPSFLAIQFAPFERGGILGQSLRKGCITVRDARELREKLGASLFHTCRELGVVVGEIEKRSRCTVFLPLEEHRRAGPEQ